jgi:hypothetical protein
MMPFSPPLRCRFRHDAAAAAAYLPDAADFALPADAFAIFAMPPDAFHAAMPLLFAASAISILPPCRAERTPMPCRLIAYRFCHAPP